MLVFTPGSIHPENIGFIDPPPLTIEIPPPVTAGDDVRTTPEDTPIVIDVLTNDNGNPVSGGVTPLSLVSGSLGAVSPAGSASINIVDDKVDFVPAADFSGQVTFTYEVQDATTPTANTATGTVTVNVAPVNDPPAWDSPSDLTNDEDAGPQTAGLTGITAGSGEDQPLRVTAASSNPTLIPDLTVDYTSPNSSGVLHFTTPPDLNGSAVITVTVTDGGLDQDLATADDNATLSQSFTVTVNPINDSPVISMAPSAVNTLADRPFTFSGANRLELDDADADAAPIAPGVRVTLSVSHGSLTPGSTANVTVSTAPPGTLTIEGKVADVNDALNNTVYSPAEDWDQGDQLSFGVDDRGNFGGGSAPHVANVTIPMVRVSHSVGTESLPGGLLQVDTTMVHPDQAELLSLLWRPRLPAGWTLVSVSGAGDPEIRGEEIVFLGSLASAPLSFSYQVRRASGQTGTQQIVGEYEYQFAGMANPATGYAAPDPLLVEPLPYHSADYREAYWVSDGTEVNRVLSYWRAGGYHSDPTGAEGYAAGAGDTGGALQHAADYRQPYWGIDGTELNRVLSYWRAGSYHADPAGADGYTPGPQPQGSAIAFSAAATRVPSPAAVSITQVASDNQYVPGGTLTISGQTAYEGTLWSLGWFPELPGGWQVVSVSGSGNPELAPVLARFGDRPEIVWNPRLGDSDHGRNLSSVGVPHPSAHIDRPSQPVTLTEVLADAAQLGLTDSPPRWTETGRGRILATGGEGRFCFCPLKCRNDSAFAGVS